jgi:hypothetical protein
MAWLCELEHLPQKGEGFRIRSLYFLDRTPAEGIAAAFDFTEHRHVPLATLCQATSIPVHAEDQRSTAFEAIAQTLKR